MFKVESTDGLSSIGMNLIDIEKNYPSICVVLEIRNQGFSVYLSDVWIEWDNIKRFIAKSKDIVYEANFRHSIESITPDEMILKIEQVNGEIVSIRYKVSKSSFEHDPIQLTGSFALGTEKLSELRNAFKEIAFQFE